MRTSSLSPFKQNTGVPIQMLSKEVVTPFQGKGSKEIWTFKYDSK